MSDFGFASVCFLANPNIFFLIISLYSTKVLLSHYFANENKILASYPN